MSGYKTWRVVGAIIVLGLMLALGAQPAAAGTLNWDPGVTGGTSGGGSGIWSANGTYWYNGSADVNWTDTTGTANAVFGGTTAGTVTIGASGVTAGTLTFATTGYTLTGSTIMLAGAKPTITLNASGSTIGATLASSGGLLQTGTGTLTLSTPAAITGTVVIGNSTAAPGGTLALGVNNALPAGTAVTVDNRYDSSTQLSVLNLGTFNQNIGNLTLYAGPSIRNVITSSGGTLVLSGSVTCADTHTGSQDYAVAITAPIDLNGATRTIIDGYGANNDSSDLGDLHLNGVITTSSGTAGLTIQAYASSTGGGVSLGAANTYNGPTTLSNVSGAISLGLNANNAIPNNSAFVQSANTTLDLTAWGKTTGIATGMGSLTGAGSINLGSAGVLTIGYDNTSPAAYAGVISGAGGTIVKTGSGMLTLGGANTYTGGTTISGGTLAISGTGSLGSGTYSGTIVNNAALLFNTTSNQTLSAAVAGTGSLTQSGASTLNLTNAANSFTGATTITAGTLAIGGAGLLGGGSYAAAIANSGTLVFNTTGSQILSGAITGSGRLIQSGLGTLTLSNAGNTYSGGTSVLGGTLALNGPSSLPNSTLTVTGPGATLNTADGTAGTTTVAGLNLATGAQLVMDWGDQLQTAATATAAGNVALTPSGSFTAGTPYTLVNAAGGLNGANYFLSNTNYTATLAVTAGSVIVTPTTATPLGTAYWYGNQVSGGSAAMGLSNGTLSNWSSDSGYTPSGLVPGPAANVIFSTASGASQESNVVLGANMTVNSVTFNDSTPVTIGSDGNTLTLLSSGSGTASAISVNQNATLNARLALGAAQTWTLANGTTLAVNGPVSGAYALTEAGSGTLALNGTLAAGSTLAVGPSATLSGSGMVAGNATLAGNGVINFSTGGNIAGTLGVSGGSWTGAGTVTGLVTASGAGNVFTIASGANLTAPGGLSIAGGSLQVIGTGALGGGSYSAAIANSGALVFNTTSNQTLSGAISGSGSLYQLGSGATTISSASTNYAGGTTIGGGHLILSAATAYVSPTVVNSAGTLSLKSTASYTTAANTAFTIALNNGGTLEDVNPSNYTVISPSGGAVTASGATFINESSNAATLGTSGFFLDSGLKGSGTVTITAANAGNAVNFRNNNTSFSGTMIVNGISSTTAYANSGIAVGGCTTGLENADITVNGAMELLTTGIGWADTASGAFTMGALSGTGTVVANYSSGGTTTFTLDYTSNNGAFSGTIANGTGDTLSLVKVGSGMQILSGTNTYSGTTTISKGTLQIGGAGVLGSGSYAGTIANSSALLMNSSSNQILSGAISGSGTLTQNGTSVLTLSGTDTYTGDTVVSGGTLVVGGPLALQDSRLNYNNQGGVLSFGTQTAATFGSLTGSQGLTLNNATPVAVALSVGANGGSDTYAGALSGSGSLNKVGSGTLTLAGTNSYAGGTSISAGVLVFNSAAAVGGAGANVTIASGGVAEAGYGMDQPFVNRISPASAGVAALTANSAANFNFSTAGSASLGAVGAVTYSGMLTPAANIYRLGGGGGTLNVTSNLPDVGSPTALIASGGGSGGSVLLSGGNSYSGTTAVNAGILEFVNETSLYNDSTGSWTTANIGVAPGAALAVAVGGAGQFTTSDVTMLLTNLDTTGSVGFKGGSALGLDIGATAVSYAGVIANPSSGTLGFIKLGTGTLTLTAGNSYSGGTTVSGGLLVAGISNAFGPSNTAVSTVVVQNGATVDINGTADAATGANFNYGLTIAGSGTLGQGALINSGAGGNTSWAQSPNITLSANAAIGGTGAIYMIAGSYASDSLNLGGYTLTKTGTNTFYLCDTTLTAGSISIAQGALSDYHTASTATNTDVSILAGASLVLNGYNLPIGSLSGSGGTVSLGSNTLTVGGDNNSPGPFYGVITGTGALTKTGTGLLTLAGGNTYTLGTTISGGTLAISGSGVLGGGTYTGTIANSGALIFNTSSSQTLGGAISGNGTLIQAGPGLLALTGSNTYTTVTNVTGGTLQLGNGSSGNDGSLASSAISDNGVLAFDPYGSTQSYANPISGSGSLSKLGIGMTTLSGSNTYTGGTTISGGVLAFSNTGALPASPTPGITIAFGGALAATPLFSSSAAAPVNAWLGSGTIVSSPSGTIALINGTSDAENISLAGSSTWSVLSLGAAIGGTATYTGNLTPFGSTYNLGGGGGTLNFTPTLTGTNGLLAFGSGSGGTLIVAASNTYTGGTTIGPGTLSVGQLDIGGDPSGLGQSSNAAANLVFNGGSLQYTGGSGSTDRNFTVGTAGATIGVVTAGQTLSISGTAAAAGKYAFTKTGSGNLAFTGSNALNAVGAITVAAGDLQVGTMTFNGTNISAATTLNVAAGATFTSLGTINLTAGNGNATALTGAGTLRLRATGTSIANPDIAYAPTQAGQNNYAVYETVPIDTGTAGTTHYIVGNSNNNNFYTYYGDLMFEGGFTGAGNLYFYGTPNGGNNMTFTLAENNSAYTGNITAERGDLIIYNAAAVSAANQILLDPAAGETVLYHPWNLSTTVGALSSSGAGTAEVLQHGSATTTINQSINTTFGGLVTQESGTASIVKSGSGTLAFSYSGSNYTGTTTVSGGVLAASYLANGGSVSSIGSSTNAAGNLILNGGLLQYLGGTGSTDRLFTLGTAGGGLDASGSGTVTFSNTGTMVFSGTTAHTLTLSGANSGANTLAALITDQTPVTAMTSVVKTGPGTWLPTGLNTYTGTTTIAGGVLSTSYLPIGGVASPVGAASNSAGNIVLNGGALQYTGLTTVTDRLFTLGPAGGALDASGSGPITFSNTGSMGFSGTAGSTLTLTGSNTGQNTLSALLTDNPSGQQTSLWKSGPGTWVLAGSNSYTGPTTINNGTLQLYGGTSQQSPYTLNTGASLAIVNPAATQTAAIGSGLNFAGTGVTTLNLVAGTSWDPGTALLSVNGALAAGGTTTVNLASLGSLSAGTTYPLIDFTGSIGGSGSFVLGTLPSRVLATLVPESGQLDLYVSSFDTLKWSGAASALWDINDSGLQNFALNSNSSPTNYLQSGGVGDTVTFDDTALGNYNVNLSGSLLPGSVTVSASSNYTFSSSSGSGSIGGSGPLTKAGSGTLTILTNNTYTGGTMINGGTVVLGDGATPGIGSITGNVTINNPAGGTSLLEFNRPDNLSFPGIISGNGSLVQSGSGMLTLTADNTYTGGTTVSSGTLAIGSGGFGAALASPSVSLSNGAALVFNHSDNPTYSGTISGNGTVTKLGAGLLTFTGSNTCTGSTTISGGTLQLGNGTSDGWIGGDVADNAALVGNCPDAVTLSGAISGTGTLLQAGPGTLTLGGTNTYSGMTTVSGGTLAVGLLANGLTPSPIGQSSNAAANLVLNGGVLQYTGPSASSDRSFTVGVAGATIAVANSSAALTLSGTIASTNSANTFTVAGPGTLVLSAANVLPNVANIVVSGGTLALGSTGAQNTYMRRILTINSGAVVQSYGQLNLDVDQNTGGVDSNNVTGAGTLVLAATGASQAVPDLYFGPDASGTSYYGAHMTVATLNLGSSQRYIDATSGHNSVAEYYPNNDAYISSNIIGSGGITFYATSAQGGQYGELMLAGSNSFSGPVQVNRGAIFLNNANALTQANTLTLSNSDSTFSNFFLLGNNATVTNLQSAGTTPTNTGVANGNPTMVGPANVTNAATLTINETANTTFAGTIANAISDNYNGGSYVPGALGLALSSASTATLTLTGNNTYTGGTTISGGTLEIGAGGTTGSLSNTGGMLNNAAVVFNLASAYSYGGAMSGSGSLTQAGSGTLTLTAANSYTGGTTVNAGTLKLGSAGALPSGAATANLAVTAGTLDLAGFTANVNGLYGAGIVSNSGTAQATLIVGNNNASSTFAGAVQDAAGSVALTKVGSGLLTLTGANNYSGPTNISSGTLQLGNGGSSGSLSAAGGVNDNAMLAFNRADNITFNAAISGAGGLSNLGGNALTLGGASTYFGPTSVTAGTLNVAGSLGNTAVSVAGGATLSGTGTIAGAVTIASGATSANQGTINLVDGTIGTLALTNPGTALTLGTGGGSAAIDFELGSTTADQVALPAGSLNLNSSIAINLTQLAGTSISAGTYNLISFAALSGAGSFTLGQFPALSSNLVASLNTTANGEQLIIALATPPIAYWSGTTGASWSNAANWATTASGTTPVSSLPGSISAVYFTTAGGTNLTTTLDNDFTVASLNFTATSPSVAINGANTLTIATSAGISDPAGSAAQAINANVALAAAQSWTVNSASPLTVGGVISGAGSNTLTLAGSGTVILTAANTYSGQTTINSGTLQLGNGASNGSVDGDILNNAALIFANATTLSYGGAITGTGGVTVAGPGALTLSGADGYSGGTTISGGGLVLGNAAALGSNAPGSGGVALAGGSLDLGAYAISVPGLSLTGGTLTGSGQTLTISGPGPIDAQSGAAGANLAGSVALAKTTPGTVLLSGNNSYTGGTSIEGGVLQLGSDSALPATGSLNVNAGTLNLNGHNPTVGSLSGTSGVISNSTGIGAIDVNTAVATTFNGSIVDGLAGTTGLVKSGSGTLILANAANNYSGGTTVSGGALQLGSATALGSTSGNLTVDAGTLDLAGKSPTVGALAGAGGTVTSTGAAATLTAGAGDATSSFTGVIVDGVGRVALMKIGGGTLALGGLNTYSGGTTISGGALSITSSANLGSGNVTIGAATLQTSGNVVLDAARTIALTNAASAIDTPDLSDTTLNGPVTGTGSLNKEGEGTLTLAAPSGDTYRGATNVLSGTLLAGSDNALSPTSDLVIADGASVILDFGGGSNGDSMGAFTAGAPAPAMPALAPAGIATVPEPGTLPLLLAGVLAGLAVWRRRSR